MDWWSSTMSLQSSFDLPQLSLSSFVRVGKKFLTSTFPKAPLHDFSDPPASEMVTSSLRMRRCSLKNSRYSCSPKKKKELMEIWYTKFGPMPMWFIGTRMYTDVFGTSFCISWRRKMKKVWDFKYCRKITPANIRNTWHHECPCVKFAPFASMRPWGCFFNFLH